MIEGTGYLKFVKSRDHLYVYLHGRLEGEKLKKHLFPFGRLEAALENMYSIRDSNVLPEELVSMNCSFDDLDQWILTLETRITRNGKNIDVFTKI
ncbi:MULTISPECIES: hypothetical protein [Carnobacterium]|jgi:hypothetical protein|uniref:hypothetical protein n=1 Tax=Carnobacterium TaxID=2747 RepID=UPI0005572DC4|nr:hypothetical protein [Carnobacterium maltaromaticum]MCI1820249.1 hypothetical protein [Carnobacterium maltaromaticum]